MYIKVKVTVDARKESITKKALDTLIISTKEPKEQNRANRRVLELIASYLDIPVKNIRILSGHHKPSKIIFIDMGSKK